MTSTAHGTVLLFRASGGGDEDDAQTIGGSCTAPPVDTAVDYVYRVDMPEDVAQLEASVEAVAGANPRIAIAEEDSCLQPANVCADLGDEGECEAAVAAAGTDFYGTSTFVIVSELVDSEQTLNLHLRTSGS